MSTRLPLLKPYIYEVTLHRDGYQETTMFTGTQEACREELKRLNNIHGVWYNVFINDKDHKFLRDGYMVMVKYSRNQEPQLNTKKPPRGGSGLR